LVQIHSNPNNKSESGVHKTIVCVVSWRCCWNTLYSRPV